MFVLRNVEEVATILVEARAHICEASTSDELTVLQRTHRIATDVLFIGAQGASLVASFTKADPVTQIACAVAVALADTLKKMSRLHCQAAITAGDYIELFAGTLLFRVSNVTERMCSLTPSFLGDHLRAIETLSDVGTGVAILALHAKKIHGVGKNIHSRWRAINTICSVLFNNPADQPRPPGIHVRIDRENQVRLEISRNYAERLREVQQFENISQMETIPHFFELDPILGLYRCPISQRPIRFALTHTQCTHLHYERSVVMAWLDAHPGERPPGWPEDNDVNVQRLSEIQTVQMVIDRTLEQLLEGIRGFEIQDIHADEYEGFIFTKARELGIDNPAVSDREIIRALMANLPRGMASAVGVMMGTYRFRAEKKHKAVRRITLLPKLQLVEPQPIIDTLPAIRALLGSRSENDIDAFKQACMSRLILEVRISMDLEDYKIS
ncbi:MAG: hypothetical protein ACHQUC_06570 [Chlamydiales bacterium]